MQLPDPITVVRTVVAEYIAERLGPEFHDRKIQKMEAVTLDTILRRKNPYLFRAKNLLTAESLIEAVLDATISSGEETVFGNFLEQIAIRAAAVSYGGHKSGIKGIDLEFSREGRRYFVAIKSGPSWGNSSQIEKLKRDFEAARRTLATSGGGVVEAVFIEGCCYGQDDMPNKGSHLKLCGQRFWELVSGDDDLYRLLIQPLGLHAGEKTQHLLELRAAKVNQFSLAFIERFCDSSGAIDWERLVRYNSGRVRESL